MTNASVRRISAAIAIGCLALSTSAFGQDAVRTAGPGSPERKAITDAMRKLGDIHDRVFVVRTLSIQGAWAWFVGDPQSPDGKNHYERESALLHQDGSGWTVVDQPCSEESCDPTKELARIRASHPAAPAGIFTN